MDHVVKIKKGLDIQLQGAPAPEISQSTDSLLYAIIPDDFTGLTPKVDVKPGDRVLAGSPVMHDKTLTDVVVTSPVSGEVVAVERGERRKVMKITIKPDMKQEAVDFGKVSPETASVDDLKSLLLKSGTFAFIKQRPYDIIANPNTTPRDIFVTAFDSAPLAPDYAFVLKDELHFLETGLKALAKLTPGKVYVGVSKRSPLELKNGETDLFDGPHPAGNVGVQINHIAPINKGETVWTLNALDLLFIGRLLETGHVDFSRLVAVTGSEITKPHYVRTYAGASIASITRGLVKKADYEQRYISGNVLTGFNAGADGYLGARQAQVTVIPEGNNCNEFMGWASQSPQIQHEPLLLLMVAGQETALCHRCPGERRRARHHHVRRV